MFAPTTTVTILAATILAVAAPAHATDIIDFESIPDGTSPSVGLAINNQYEADYGVSFALDGSAEDLVLGDYGGFDEGWASDYGRDTLAPSYDFGDFFLAHPQKQFGADIDDVLISYSTPTEALGFDLMDIDNSERWTITAYTTSGIQKSKVYDVSDGGDGLPTHVFFQTSAGNAITQVRLHLDSPGSTGMGLDNFTPTSTPAPGPAALAAVAGALSLRRRRRARPALR